MPLATRKPVLRHVVESQQFDRPLLEQVFEVASQMEDVAGSGGSDEVKGRIMASLFYEPSTRTRLSFEFATYHLGGRVLSSEAAREFSSAAKGESIEDTIRDVRWYRPPWQQSPASVLGSLLGVLLIIQW